MGTSSRTPTVAPVLAILLTLSSGEATATPSVDLFFVEHNGAPIADATQLAVLPADTFGVEMRMTTDERGTSGYSISVDFDSAGDGRITLDDASSTNPPGLPMTLGIGTPWPPDHPNGVPGFVKHFNAVTLTADPVTVNATFLIGTLSFSVTSAIFGGPATIAPGLFFPGVDEVLSNELELIGGSLQFTDISANAVFNTLTLTAVPEPSTGLLLAGGLAALGWRRLQRLTGCSAASATAPGKRSAITSGAGLQPRGARCPPVPLGVTGVVALSR